MEAEIDAGTWKPGRPESNDVRLEDPVGLVSGETTIAIRIMSDGRYVHAFPVVEQG